MFSAVGLLPVGNIKKPRGLWILIHLVRMQCFWIPLVANFSCSFYLPRLLVASFFACFLWLLHLFSWSVIGSLWWSDFHRQCKECVLLHNRVTRCVCSWTQTIFALWDVHAVTWELWGVSRFKIQRCWLTALYNKCYLCILTGTNICLQVHCFSNKEKGFYKGLAIHLHW